MSQRCNRCPGTTDEHSMSCVKREGKGPRLTADKPVDPIPPSPFHHVNAEPHRRVMAYMRAPDARCGCESFDDGETLTVTRCPKHPAPDPDAGARAACEAFGYSKYHYEAHREVWRAVAEAVRKADRESGR